MARTISEKLNGLSPERRQRVEARAQELIEEEMSLRDLRKALGRTQTRLAAELGVGQDTVSRYESRSDMLLSTLSEYVQKIGGELELTVRFSNRAPVRLKGLADISTEPPARVSKRAKSRNTVIAARKSRGNAHRRAPART